MASAVTGKQFTSGSTTYVDWSASTYFKGPDNSILRYPHMWQVPQGVTRITIECVGGGGAGGNAAGFGLFESPCFAGGGAGGSYSRKELNVTPGSLLFINVSGEAQPKAKNNTYTLERGDNGNASYVYTFVTETLPPIYYCYAPGGQGGGHAIRTSYRYYGMAGFATTSGSIGDVSYRGGNGGGNTPDQLLLGVGDRGKWCSEIVTPVGANKVITTKTGACTLYPNCPAPDFSGPGGGTAGSTGKGGDATMCNPTGGLSTVPMFLYGYPPDDLPTYPSGGNGVSSGNPGQSGNGYANYSNGFGQGGSGAAAKGTGFGVRTGGKGGGGYVRISWQKPILQELSCLNLFVSSSCCPIDIGCTVYTDPELTVTASNGYYYDGTKCWIVLNGTINTTGSCGTTTSTTSTTTTTPPPTGFYNVTQYSCPDCDPVGSLIAYSSTTLNIGTYYSIVDGYTYLVNGTTSGPSYDVDLSSASSGASCFALCIT